MYAQQPIQNPFQAGPASGGPQHAARILQETVMRLKDLDVRLEALNQDLAVLCDTVGNPQAAQLARTPRQFLASNIVAGQIGHGVTPNIAASGSLIGAPPTDWAAQGPPFAGQQPVGPAAFVPSPYAALQTNQGAQHQAFVPSPYAALQTNQGVQQPAFAPSPYVGLQANQGAQQPAFVPSPYAALQANQGAQHPAFAPSPYVGLQANQGAQHPAFAPSPYVGLQANQGAQQPAFGASQFAPETNWGAQGPAFAPNPQSVQYAGAVPSANWAAGPPSATNNPYALASPYANVASTMINQPGLVDPRRATVGAQAGHWNVPSNVGPSVGIPGFAGTPGQSIQAPLGNMIR